ncbi:MAG TPA: copper amine oxidase N-terminal domain-containing protein [Candidatus Limnocylindria bacterium]|nr:copper amine oxidase N-terminal domain-containing protein [Candidatus Limnocylindria bacterium]
MLWTHPAARVVLGVAAMFVGSLGASSAALPATVPQSVVAQETPSPAPAPAPAQAPAAAPDFGTPPSGEVPILFNDHHVYAKPDRLRQNRVLAALVRGNTILIPLRSMFEQMGATVSYDPGTKTAHVSKTGSDVSVTIGKPEVIINGESRPLDVPPEIYQGSVVVPVRVISEGMGAYVQWVPDRRVVVIRYVTAAAPTPPPTAPPTLPPPPTAPPTLPPTPKPKPRYDDHFIVGDYIFAPTVWNEFSPGNARMGASGAFRAGTEFTVSPGLTFMLEATGSQYQYNHYGTLDGTVPRNFTCGPALSGQSGCVTTIGGTSSVYVPSTLLLDRDIDGRFGFKVANPRIYIAAAYLWRNGNYGYPQQHGFGFGVEKLPDYDQKFTFFGSYYYYPNVKGAYSDPTTGIGYDPTYNVQRGEIGVSFKVVPLGAESGVNFEIGGIADRGNVKQAFPTGFRHYSGFAGLGVNF